MLVGLPQDQDEGILMLKTQDSTMPHPHRVMRSRPAPGHPPEVALNEEHTSADQTRDQNGEVGAADDEQAQGDDGTTAGQVNTDDDEADAGLADQNEEVLPDYQDEGDEDDSNQEEDEEAGTGQPEADDSPLIEGELNKPTIMSNGYQPTLAVSPPSNAGLVGAVELDGDLQEKQSGHIDELGMADGEAAAGDPGDAGDGIGMDDDVVMAGEGGDDDTDLDADAAGEELVQEISNVGQDTANRQVGADADVSMGKVVSSPLPASGGKAGTISGKQDQFEEVAASKPHISQSALADIGNKHWMSKEVWTGSDAAGVTHAAQTGTMGTRLADSENMQ